MNKLFTELKDNNYQITSIKYLEENIVVICHEKKYLLIKKENYNEETIEYLNSIGCDYYLPIIQELSDYYLCNYYESDNNVRYLVLALADIHLKSIKTVNYQNKESFFNNKVREIDNLMNYYLNLQDYIEEMYYTRKDYYEMIISISKVYNILRTSRYFLDKWNDSNSIEYREVFLIGNIDLKNFVHNDKSYFLNLKNTSKGNLIKDIVLLYKFFDNDDIYELFELYNNKIKLTEEELYLFLSSICLLPMIKFSNNVNYNLGMIKRFYEYIDKTMTFVLEKDKEYQEANEEIFKQENNNIKFSSDKNKN